MTASFIHLHVHSEFSLLDGAIRIKDMLAHCEEHQASSIALTDNGVMYGAIEFYLAAKEKGIKPIIGCELYLVDDQTVKNRDFTRLILLAKTYNGYQNLSEIVSISHVDGFYYRPRIDLAHIQPFKDELIAISPGGRGPISQHIRNNELDKAKEEAQALKALFGEDFYLGVQVTGMSLEDIVNEESKQIAAQLDIPLVATNNAYYHHADDAINRRILNAIQFGKTLEEDAGFQNNELYLKSPEEMAEALPDYEEAIANTRRIAESCNVDFDTGRVLLPDFKCPDQLSPEQYLEQLIWKGVEQLYPAITEEIKQRVEFETSIIKKMGYPIYFLIIYDFLDFCRRENIPIGPGRGSAAGSIVAYALGITKIDPLKYNLLFERFLNPDRVTMPDIDLDFCIKRRGEVIDYIVQKYGEDRVAQIATFGTMQSRAVVRDVGRVLDIPLNEVDRIAKLIPSAPGKYTSIQEAIDTVAELKKAYESNQDIKKLLDYGMRLEGMSRHSSTHAAGVVISRDPLSQLVPLIKNDGQVATQYSMTILETIGLLKMDILGLRNLTVLEEAKHLIQEKTGESLDLDALPLDDVKTYAMLSSGATTGIFQLESSGMRGLIKDLKPDTFEDIIALLALYRPGPLGSGMVSDFISNKSGETKVHYDLDVLEPVLKDTYGMILYQEQVMQIASVVGGFTLAQADMLRRAMGKKKKSEMDKLKEEFLSGAKAKDINVKKAQKIFELCYKFAEYGFNKSHSAAYAMISYQTAYLKANHPKDYMAALLSSVLGVTDKCALYIAECREMEIPILPPDINSSECSFTSTDQGIRFGLGAIKNVGEGAIISICENRKEGPYASLMDCCLRVDLRQVNKRVFESLIRAGALDEIDEDRAALLAQLEPTLDRAQAIIKERESGQTGLFGQEYDETAFIPDTDVPPMTEAEKLKGEKDITGLYISGHPLHIIKDKLDEQEQNTLSFNEDYDNQDASLIGILSNTRRVLTRTKKEMLIGSLEDLHGAIDVIAFQTDNFEDIAQDFQDDNIVSISGRIRASQDRLSLSISRITVLNDMYRPKQLHIDIQSEDELEKCEQLRKLCSKNRGDMPLYLHLEGVSILAHKKYWVTQEAKPMLEEMLGSAKVWEA